RRLPGRGLAQLAVLHDRRRHVADPAQHRGRAHPRSAERTGEPLMELTLTADQEALREGVREFCARRYSEDALRAQTPADRALWSDLAGLGVFALRLSEDDGGA